MPTVPLTQWAALMPACAFSQASAYLYKMSALPCAILCALTTDTPKPLVRAGFVNVHVLHGMYA